ncbi:cytidylate kinase [Clostridium sp. CAG:557]|nr:cytidylate kinase [Clostridium sp. CAG:557]
MISIALDGPAGAGKSTIAKAVAKKLSFIYVDTGALYRAIGFYAIKNKISSENEIISSLKKIKVDLKFENNLQKVFLCDEDISEEIRTPEVSMMASKISAIPAVREFLFDLQQDLAKKNNVIMDGRDIGTVILPEANVKIFLTASSEKRAERRYKELIEKGLQVDYDDILKDIIKRDYDDSNRKIAPLKAAADAIFVDTSAYNLEESINLILTIINNKLK